MKVVALVAVISSIALAGCGGGGNGTDAGRDVVGMDSGAMMPDAFRGGPRDAGPGVDGGCIPSVEICGDHIDENCDGRETPCGDNDHDTYDACSPSDTDLTMCDCDDFDPNTFPARGSLPGGTEVCDGKDNDCDGRIDESAACCAACQALGDVTRGDLCTVGGECACSANAGMAACSAGQTCCSSGCVDLTSDTNNCNACGTACDPSTDRCTGGHCMCGTANGCSGSQTCSGGACH